MAVPYDVIASRFLSIESARLEFSSPPAAGVHRHIHGHILINGNDYNSAISVFKRSANDPQNSSSSSSSDNNLTLCGPLFPLWPEDPDFLYVDLHEANMGPLIVQRVRIRPQLHQLVNPNIPIEIVAIGNDCVLKVCMISLAPSVVATTELCLEPSCPSDTMWLVSGKVWAVQKSNYQERYVERTFPLFWRPEDDPARVLPNGGIPLDRGVVVVPVQRDMERIRKEYEDFHHCTRFLPTDKVHGEGSSITIHVDLNLLMDNGDPCFLGGALEFEVKGAHQVGTRYEKYVVGAPKRKGNVQLTVGEKKYCSPDVKLKPDKLDEIESFVVGDHRMLTLKVYLSPMNHTFSNDYMEPAIFEEAVETELELYVSEDEDHPIP